MRRRRLLQLAALPLLRSSGQQKPKDEVVASATRDATPRVGVVLSSFAGGEDHDGTKLAGLKEPCAVDGPLSSALLDAMVRKAIEMGTRGASELSALVAPDDWVVLHVAPRSDGDVVRAVIGYLADHKCGGRITLFGDPAIRAAGDKVEWLDPAGAPAVELPVPGGEKLYRVPKIVQQCDKWIAIAPLAMRADCGAALSIAAYASLAAGKPEHVVDLFAFHPADYAILGGRSVYEGEEAQPVTHNLVVAGPNAVAVDAVSAAVLGFDTEKLDHLREAEKRGFGVRDVSLIWTRGNEIEQAQRKFRKPGRFA